MVPQSIRHDMKNIELSIGDEVLLMRLFGKSMFNKHGIRSQKTWKKIQERIYKIIKMAIEKNLRSDGFHKLRLEMYLDQYESACKAKEVTDIKIILLLVAMIIELLGNLPDYSERTSLNKNSDYCLSGLRNLIYYQSANHKRRTIIEAARYKPYCEYHKSDDLHEMYVSKYNGNSTGFIDWYKRTYPDVYMKIF